jgi:hypothetical protein
MTLLKPKAYSRTSSGLRGIRSIPAPFTVHYKTQPPSPLKKKRRLIVFLAACRVFPKPSYK